MKIKFANIIQRYAKFVDFTLSGLIKILQLLALIMAKVRAVFITCASFFFVILLFSPMFSFLTRNLIFWLIVVFIIIFPLLSPKFISFLEYQHYIFTEYLYNKAVYYKIGKIPKSFRDFYIEYEEILDNEDIKNSTQGQKNEDIWTDFFHNFLSSSGGSYYRGYRKSRGDKSKSKVNSIYEFKDKYERAIKILNLTNNTDEYQVKLAYRKLAKKYHPDLNDDEGAVEMFEKINSAYKFLSKENIDNYMQLKK